MHEAKQGLIDSLVHLLVNLRVRGRSALTRTRSGQVAVQSDRGFDPSLPKECAVRALTVSTSATVLGILLTAGTSGVAAAAEGDVITPEVEVIGHYETGVGTSDAASEGSVTYKLIEDRPVMRPGEILEFVPGMIITQHSGDGKANQYFLRGYNLDHGTDFASYVAGMPVNLPTNAHGQGYSDLNFVIPELVSRIDFKKGPYYADEGDFSSVGAAHIEYFDQFPASTGLAQVTVGSYDYVRALVAASPKVGDGNLLLALEYQGSDGPWENPANFNKYNTVLRYSEGTAQSGFNVTAMAYDAKWDSTDQIPQRAVAQGLIPRFGAIDLSDGGQTTRYSASFQSRTPLNALGAPQFELDAFVIGYNLCLWSNFTFFLDDTTNGDQFHQADRRVIYGLRPSLAWSGKLGEAETTTRVGLQLRYDDINVTLTSTANRQFVSLTRQDKVGEGTTGVFVDNSTQWTMWFRSVAGIRFDYFNFDDTSNIPENSGSATAQITSPKLALVFGPWYKTEYFLDAGYGFHSNDARGVFTVIDPKSGQPADPVTPLVRTKGAELGVRTEIIPKLQTSLALWILTQDSELLFTGDGGSTEPSRASRREGIEWITSYQPLGWLLFDFELNLSKARFTSIDPNDPTAGPYIPNAIPVTAHFGASIQNLGRWSGAFEVRYFGPMPLIEDNSVRGPPSTIANLRVGYQFDKTWSAHLDVLNLFNGQSNDISYYYASCLPSEVGSANCPVGGGGPGVNDIHFHPAEPRQFRFTVVAHF
jgi:outer membrane receptor protein involved in Fe transport